MPNRRRVFLYIATSELTTNSYCNWLKMLQIGSFGGRCNVTDYSDFNDLKSSSKLEGSKSSLSYIHFPPSAETSHSRRLR